MLTIQGPRGGPDVTRRNKRSILYITGDDNTDGSIRIIFTPGDDDAHLELRTAGVFNDTGLRLSSSSLRLGRDMIVSAAAGFIETVNPSAIVGHQKALIPHIEFTELGTNGHAHAPILNILETFIVFPGPATGEIIGTTIGQGINSAPRRLLDSSIHEVGSVGATATVQISFYMGSDNSGVLFNRFKIPASDMVANQPLVIDYKEDFGFEGDTDIFQEFVSSSNISLKTDAGGDILTTHIGHEMKELDMVLEELVLTNDLSITFGNDLAFVTNNRF
ncbi:MAG: hypothetical protein V3R41_06010 [Gammaproteobacteria bacterium]